MAVDISKDIWVPDLYLSHVMLKTGLNIFIVVTPNEGVIADLFHVVFLVQILSVNPQWIWDTFGYAI